MFGCLVDEAQGHGRYYIDTHSCHMHMTHLVSSWASPRQQGWSSGSCVIVLKQEGTLTNCSRYVLQVPSALSSAEYEKLAAHHKALFYVIPLCYSKNIIFRSV